MIIRKWKMTKILYSIRKDGRTLLIKKEIEKKKEPTIEAMEDIEFDKKK